ncbi:MAG: dienelactone hydrolase family protein, partial [bacterium]|nr:dienelactone hydrolase family protein [bacterium]
QITQAMTTDEYLRELERGISPHTAEFASAARIYTLESIRKYAIVPAGGGDELFERVLKIPNSGVLDAPLRGGRHPVVIYHPGLGGNVFENISLCERLASRGYVVIASTFFHQEDWQDRFYCGQVYTSFDDIDLLVNLLSERMPSADVSRIAVIGHSFGAQVALMAACRPHNSIDCVIALDTTLDYVSVERINSPLYRNTSWRDTLDTLTDGFANCRASILNISGTMPDSSIPDYTVVRRLIGSRLHLATVNYEIAHEAFLSSYILATSHAQKLAPSAGGSQVEQDRRAYAAMLDMIVAFLDQELMDAAAMPLSYDETIGVATHEPVDRPSASEALLLYRAEGIDEVERLYRELQEISPRAGLSPYRILDDMIARDDQEGAVEFLGFLLSFQSNQDNWRLEKQLGDVHFDIGNYVDAGHHYQRSLEHCDDFHARDEIQIRLQTIRSMNCNADLDWGSD